MNCPVCKRELAPTLSICLTCGAMMNDTVREELETKIVRPSVPQLTKAEIPKFEPIKPWTPQPIKMHERAPEPELQTAAPEPLKMSNPVPPPPQEPIKMSVAVQAPSTDSAKPKVITSKLKKETSPTLVGFQPSNPTVPDWRLQLQNSIRKRALEPRIEPTAITAAPAVSIAAPITPSRVTNHSSQAAAPGIQNEKLANAIKRIEASKRAFGSGAAVGIAAAAQARAKKPSLAQKSFPFDVVERKPKGEKPSLPGVPSPEMPKPKLVAPMPVAKKKFDTNKLLPIPEPALPLEVTETEQPREAATEVRTKVSFERLRFWSTPATEETAGTDELLQDEIDDLAPFSMRFGAAVFDLIIGSFAAGILLSPLLLSSSIGSAGGLFVIFGGWLFVMFAYFTGSIVFMGRTFGMKLFSIEMIDAEANELPTFHQAAVHSAVYLLSLMLFGLGFVPAFFNEERRAMHDLVSGTLLIREY